MKMAIVRPGKEAHKAAREHLAAARAYVLASRDLGVDDEDMTLLALAENRLLLAVLDLAPHVETREEA